MNDPENDPCINGPKLAAWLRTGDRMPVLMEIDKARSAKTSIAHLYSRVNNWAKGEQAKVETVDKWLTLIGCHISELPDDFYEDHKPRGAARRFSEFEKRRALQLLNDGFTNAEVARGLGCSPKSVALWKKAAA